MGPGPSGPGNEAPDTRAGGWEIASMGPGPSGPGNLASLSTLEAVRAVLQWGRDRAVPEIESRQQATLEYVELQWGRDRAVPEIPQWFWAKVLSVEASMGPGPSGPGNTSTCSTSSPRKACFNGAGTERSRKLA